MGWFKKKSDPISERARALNQEIAALEAQIRELHARESESPLPNPTPTQKQTSPPPRLRSTVLPQSQAESVRPSTSLPPTSELLFEGLEQDRLQAQPEVVTTEHYNELGVRKYDLVSVWRRLKNHFRGPATTNPKLVNYLAAGSIQGLRPLRYEKRVARNRFIFAVILLVLILWGIFAYLKR